MAGDTKPTRGTTTTTTTTGRTTRFASSRSTTRSYNIEPAPIVLEIQSTIVRVGYAEQFQPQHVIKIDKPLFEGGDDSTSVITRSESEWYVALSPIMEQIYDRLMCKPSTRRVVLLTKPYPPTAFQNSVKQHLWNRNVPSVVELDTLQTVPIAQGWKRGLVVHLSREETVCVCHCDGYIIPYTYQIIPTGYNFLLEGTDDGNITLPTSDENVSRVETKINDRLLNLHSPDSLVVAILMCLQECPRDLRAHVVSNIVFCGDGVTLLPDLPRRVTKKVEQILESSTAAVKEEAESAAGSSSSSVVFGMIPIDMASLRPLAARLRLVSCAPHRPDWISWVGGSLYAAAWHKYDEDETPIPWIFPPKKLDETTAKIQ
jgi:hypothetical protein